ncbi:MAG: hypothetical protein VX335_00485 [Pseudomonadota bacterium]|nr:hypothetical protein [Pseudomonadota bacterium]
MAKTNIHWSYYTFGFVSAIIIGIDCAINAAFYMSMMGGLYAIPVLIVFAALAGLILNAILYANDLPESLAKLDENLNEFAKNEFSFNALLEALKTNTPLENTKLITKNLFLLSKEVIALASGIVIGLFTYDAYLGMALTFMNGPLIVIFCLAYVVGTYALVRTSLNPEYADGETTYSKLLELRISGVIITFILTAVMITATYWTMLTFFGGAVSAATTISPILGPVIPILFALLLIGETVFSTKTAIWLGHKIQNFCDGVKINKEKYSFRNLFLHLMTILNAIGNAAITAAGSTKVAGTFGFVLSFGVMYKSCHEIDIDDEELEKSEKEKIKKSMKIATFICFSITAIWLSYNFLTPLLVTIGVLNPALTSILIAITIICTVALVTNILSSNRKPANGSNDTPIVISACKNYLNTDGATMNHPTEKKFGPTATEKIELKHEADDSDQNQNNRTIKKL